MLISKSLTLSSSYRVIAILCVALLIHGALLGAIVLLSSDTIAVPKKAQPLLFVQQGQLIFEKEVLEKKTVEKQVVKKESVKKQVIEKQQVKRQDLQRPKVKQETPKKITHTAPALKVIQKKPVSQTPAQSNQLASKHTAVLLPHTKATAGSNPLPSYPKLSKRLKEQGTVFISLRVLRDGSVVDVRIKKSSGFARLDVAALKAVKDWRYTPAMQNNKPIEFDYSQPVLFTLR